MINTIILTTIFDVKQQSKQVQLDNPTTKSQCDQQSVGLKVLNHEIIYKLEEIKYRKIKNQGVLIIIISNMSKESRGI